MRLAIVIALGNYRRNLTIDEFISERQKLYDEIYKEASEAYTAKYNEFMGN